LRGRARQAAVLKLEKALERQSEAQENVNEVSKKYTPKALADAEDDLTVAKLNLEEAQIAVADSTQDIIDKQNELNDVVNGAATDSQKYKDAQKDLTDAQNAERDAVDALADAYDRQAEAARQLKKAKDDLAIAAKGTTNKQEAQAQQDTGINPNTGLPFTSGSSGGSGARMPEGLPNIDFSNIDFSGIDLSGVDFSQVQIPAPVVEPQSIDLSTIDWSTIDFSGIDFSGFSVGGLATLAEGGIVNRPTLAMIGEGGEAEAVIPLSRLGNMGGSTSVTINVNGGDPNAVVDALRKYMRQNGSIPIRTSSIF
jgi:hypothetical protein